MKKKYILQIRRRYLWEDIAIFTDFNTAMFYFIQFKAKSQFVRLLEVCVL